jgi:hypothetical protein
VPPNGKGLNVDESGVLSVEPDWSDNFLPMRMRPVHDSARINQVAVGITIGPVGEVLLRDYRD